MSVSTNDLKNGMALNLPDGLMTVVEFQHVKPGKGGAFVRTKLKNVRTGAVLERTFRADEKVAAGHHRQARDAVPVPRGRPYVFMDTDDYEQVHVEGRRARPRGPVPEGGRHRGAAHLRRARSSASSCPPRSSSTVTDTEPGVQGDRVSGARKPATLETGLVVQVPLFVEPGEAVKVDTRTGEYLARA